MNITTPSEGFVTTGCKDLLNHEIHHDFVKNTLFCQLSTKTVKPRTSCKPGYEHNVATKNRDAFGHKKRKTVELISLTFILFLLRRNLLLPVGVRAERQRAKFIVRIYRADGLPRYSSLPCRLAVRVFESTVLTDCPGIRIYRADGLPSCSNLLCLQASQVFESTVPTGCPGIRVYPAVSKSRYSSLPGRQADQVFESTLPSGSPGIRI